MTGSTRHRLAALLGTGLSALALGCAQTQAGPDQAASSDENLVATMQVETGANAVQLTLHVTNTSSSPIELQFSSGQRYDFRVTTVDDSSPDETLWTWSADKSFMQALGTETLPPGGTLRYTEAWPTGGRTGEFIGIGEITSTNRPVRQLVRFELTGEE